MRPEKEKKRKKEVRVCLYCGINTVKGDKAYCSEACHKYDLEYREWLKQEKK